MYKGDFMERPFVAFTQKKPLPASALIKLAAEKNAQLMREKTVQEHREILDKLAEVRLVSPLNHVDAVQCAGVPCEWISRTGSRADKVVLYIHGGSWAFGNLKTARAAGIHLCEAAGFRVLSVEYSLSPEHPYPKGLTDCRSVYDWLLENGYTNRDILFFGDSAGGNLCLALLHQLRDEGEALPLGVACASPAVDLTAESQLIRDAPDLIYTIWEGKEEDIFSLYAGDHPRDNAYISPLYGDLQHFPPILIHVGEEEAMMEDCVAFGNKARQQGGRVLVKVWKGMFHDFTVVGNTLLESGRSMRQIGWFFQKLVDKSSS